MTVFREGGVFTDLMYFVSVACTLYKVNRTYSCVFKRADTINKNISSASLIEELQVP